MARSLLTLLFRLLGGRSAPRRRSGYGRPPQRVMPRQPIVRAGDIRPTVTPHESRALVRGRAYVVDGDTITVAQTRLRLFGVDAPELDHPYGQKAKWALVSLCKGRTVEARIIEQDAHGRYVARCFLDDGRDLSAEMVKLGLAIDWPKYSHGEYRAFEVSGARKKLWLADARQKGRFEVWQRYEAQVSVRITKD